jgi:transcriptional regulator with XRE-family HTH domain
MEPVDLLIWRRARKLTQTALAVALGVARQTVTNWEHGHTRLPKGFEARLAALTAAAGPALVTPDTARHRGDLQLYDTVLSSNHGRLTHRGPEHPGRLVPELAPPDGAPFPWSVLDSEPYKAALATLREGAPKRTSGDLWGEIEATAQGKAAAT